MVPAQITSRGARDFFDPLNGTNDIEGHFKAKKISYFLLLCFVCCSPTAPDTNYILLLVQLAPWRAGWWWWEVEEGCQANA